MQVRSMPEPKFKLTFYMAHVRVVTRRDYCSVTTCVVPMQFNSLSHSRWEIYNDCKQAAMCLYPDTNDKFEIVDISEVK